MKMKKKQRGRANTNKNNNNKTTDFNVVSVTDIAFCCCF